jgi:predicted phage terminase large subunit-like protein
MPAVDRRKLWVGAFCDPAGGPRAGRSQSGLSRAAIIVLGQDDLERVFILDVFIRRIPPDQLIDHIFATHQRWSPAVFGIDSSGPQLEFAQIVQREARERGFRVPLRFVAQRENKTFSIETSLQPLSSAGRLMFMQTGDWRALKDEFTSFPDGMYRDGLDALANAIKLLPTVLPAHLRAMSRSQLETYLTRTGMPRDQIIERLAQHADANG